MCFISITYIIINKCCKINLYSEKYKTLKKGIKEDTNEWKYRFCSWIGRINVIKVSMPSKAIYRVGTIPIEIPMAHLIKQEQIIQKICMETQKTLKEI